MRGIIVGSIRFSIVSWILCGFIYPLATNLFAQVLFPLQANGSLVRSRHGEIVGSVLIGQNWIGSKWFHGRPSATIDVDPNDPNKTVASPYNASSSGGSNLGPTSEKLWERLSTDRKALEVVQPELSRQELPADMLTASASGLDPEISVASAALQVPRIAGARGIPEPTVRALIAKQLIGRQLGFLGEPRVNVLRLNLSLEGIQP